MRALVLEVESSEAELAADALWSLGVVAVEERSGDAGTVELWTSLGDDEAAIVAALARRGARWRVRFVDVDDAVVDTWRDHAQPTWIDPALVVWPAWIDTDAQGLSADAVDAGVTAVRIEPGATFGMGDHPTTVLCLRAVHSLVDPLRALTVLDVGCGSGVLAIAAVMLGAARAEAIDISPAAESVTTANAQRNGVADVVRASTTPLQQVAGTFDLVLANILAPALVELAPDLRRVLAPGGTLVISGILAARHDHVLAALEPLRVVASLECDGWAAVSLRA